MKAVPIKNTIFAELLADYGYIFETFSNNFTILFELTGVLGYLTDKYRILPVMLIVMACGGILGRTHGSDVLVWDLCGRCRELSDCFGFLWKCMRCTGKAHHAWHSKMYVSTNRRGRLKDCYRCWKIQKDLSISFVSITVF